MARSCRNWTHQNWGTYHVISRAVGREILFHDREKEYQLNLLEQLLKGYFAKLHRFVFMGNHFHWLVTMDEEAAQSSSFDSLKKRFYQMTGKNPPVGSVEDGVVLPDDDLGEARLRRRLGSLSCFVQDFKQQFSRWYNKQNNRVGTLWEGRFKSPTCSKGFCELELSAYIDLNPIRAKLVSKPEDYRWSSMGLWARSPKRAASLLTPFQHKWAKKENYAQYRLFVYKAGALKKPGKGHLTAEQVKEIERTNGNMGFKTRLAYKIKNYSEGLGIGTQAYIEDLQKKTRKKYIKARPLFQGGGLFTTRVLKPSG